MSIIFQLMTFGTFRNLSAPSLTVPVLRRLTSEEDSSSALTLRENLGVVHFLSRSEESLGDSEAAKSLIKAVYETFERRIEWILEAGKEADK